MFKLNKLIAFTLSEVLMVIGIIGVVAAITLPNVSNSTGNKVNVAKVKKVYSELAAAWDKAMLRDPITNATSLTAATVANKIRANLKPKGVNAIYAPKNGASNSNCVVTATLLADGSTFCILTKYTRGTEYAFDIAFDIDGPNKGANAVHKDIFPASITFRSGSINPPTVEAIHQSSSAFNTEQSYLAAAKGKAYSSYPMSTLWILNYDNMDYLECSTIWDTKTTCK